MTKALRFSISKYDDKFLIDGKVYSDEWTSISDVGSIYNGKVFTFEEYLRTEEMYIKAFLLIMTFFSCDTVKLKRYSEFSRKDEKYLNIINNNEYLESRLKKGSEIENRNNSIADLIRICLRECIMDISIEIDHKSKTTISFGYDYYMTLYTIKPLPDLFNSIKQIGLFVR